MTKKTNFWSFVLAFFILVGGFWGQVPPLLCPWCFTALQGSAAQQSFPLVVDSSLFHYPEHWGPNIATILLILNQWASFPISPKKLD